MKKLVLTISFILCGIITAAQEVNMDYYIHLKIIPNTTLYFTIYCFEDNTPIYIVNGDRDTTMYFSKLYDKISAKQFFNKKSSDLQVFKIANIKNESVDFYIYGDVAYFRCNDQSNIQSINIKHNPILEWLSVQETPISSLDVSNNPNLKVLLICSNNLTSLNLSNNPKLKLLAAHGNPWTTEMFDQIMCSLTDRTGKGDTIDTQLGPDDIGKGQLELISSPNDPNYKKFMQTNLANATNKNWVLVNYQLTELSLQTNGTYDCSSSIESVVEAMELNVFPNPASDILNISCNEIIKSVSIINILGQEVYFQKNNQPNAQINTSKLTSGNYILKIETLENIITKSIIIN